MDHTNATTVTGSKANTTAHNAMPSPSVPSHDEEDSAKSASDQNSGEDDNAPPVPYRDYSHERKEESPKARRTGKTTQTFPMILHEILSHPEFEDIISWLPHGRAWRIVRHKAFEERVIPLFFRHGRYSSFARQVNGWGFRRITHGTDYNAYYHEMFLRGLPHICNKMRRLTSKDEDRVKNEDAPTPDFYALSRANPLPSDSKTPAKQTLAAAPGPILPSSVGPVLGIAAPPFSRGTKALADMSLADLEKERTEILRQMQMRVGASAPESGMNGMSTAQMGAAQMGSAQMGAAQIGAFAQAPGATTPYANPSGVGAPGAAPWNAPPSGIAAAPAGETGGISQAALYQALISQLTSAAGNQGAPARPPPPPPATTAAPSNQSILEALLSGGGAGGAGAGGGSGGLMQLLNSGGGGMDANNPALRSLQMQLQQAQAPGGAPPPPPPQGSNDNGPLAALQRQLQSAGGGVGADASNPALRNLQMQLQQQQAQATGGPPPPPPQGGNDSGPMAALQRQLLSAGGGGADTNNPALRNLQMQLQQQQAQATGGPLPPQGGIDNGAMAGMQRQPPPPIGQQQGRNVDPTSSMQLAQGAAAAQQGGDDNTPTSDFLRQYQQAMTRQQGGGVGGGVGGAGEGDIIATIQRQIQQAQANQQRGGGEDEYTATIQRQIQEQTQRQQQQLRQQEDGNNNNEASESSQQALAPGQQSGHTRDMSNLQMQLQHGDPATRLQLQQMLAGRLSGGQGGQPTNNSGGGSNGTPDIAALAAMMGLPGFPRPNDSGNN
jgi:hypothetical protein